MILYMYVGKRVSLSSCFFFGHRSYTGLRDKWERSGLKRWPRKQKVRGSNPSHDRPKSLKM